MLSHADEILALWVPASLQALTDFSRPLLFNLFTSSNIKASVLSPDEAALEEDSVGLAVSAFGFQPTSLGSNRA